MQAIPKKLLIHSVMLHKTKSKDRWGRAEMEEGTQLRKVRLEPSSKIIRDKNGAELQLAAVLFFDCKNSRPKDVVISVDDVLSFNGQEFRVQAVEPLYDGERLHHYEIGLIKHAKNQKQGDV